MEEGIFVVRKKRFDESYVLTQDLHVFLTSQFDNLHALADQLGITRLSAFLDESNVETDYYEVIQQDEEMHEEWQEQQKWFAPDEAIKSIKTLAEYLEQGNKSTVNQFFYSDLVTDLKDCLRLLLVIHAEDDLFHFYPFLDL